MRYLGLRDTLKKKLVAKQPAEEREAEKMSGMSPIPTPSQSSLLLNCKKSAGSQRTFISQSMGESSLFGWDKPSTFFQRPLLLVVAGGSGGSHSLFPSQPSPAPFCSHLLHT